jgi:hypothetical protein
MEVVSAAAAHLGANLSSSYSDRDNAHPNNLGTRRTVPSMLVVSRESGNEKIIAVLPIPVVWAIAVPVVSTLAKKRE